MFETIVRLAVKNHTDTESDAVRGQYGRLGSVTGIAVNLLLSGTKFLAGTLAGSVSVVGDAVNNLSDAGSSILSLVSFRLSGKPADKKHPFGHARLEYLLSTLVSVVILFVATELVKTSIGKILNPEPAAFSWLTAGVLLFSICAKLWLNRFYTYLEHAIGSSMLKAVALDSFSDVMATSAVLLSSILSPLIGFQLDGYMGVCVALFISVSGVRILVDMLDSLLGKSPPAGTIRLIESHIRAREGVIGLHDLIIHDYGPGRCFASVHVEVDANSDIMASHDMIDNIEWDVARDHHVHLVIHLDPVVTDDPEVQELKRIAEEAVRSVDERLAMHDFRVVKGTTHSNLIFDVVAPFQDKRGDDAMLEAIEAAIRSRGKNLFPVITIDRSFALPPDEPD